MENGMITAEGLIERSIKDRERVLEGFECEYERFRESLTDITVSIDKVSLEIYQLKRALEVLKNA
jgi:hypothetical protein